MNMVYFDVLREQDIDSIIAVDALKLKENKHWWGGLKRNN